MEPHGLLRPLRTVVSLGLRERGRRMRGRERGQGQSPRTYTHNDTAHNVVLWCGGDGRSRAVFSIIPHNPTKHGAEAQVNGGHGVRGFLVFSAMTQHCLHWPPRDEIGSPVCTSFSRCACQQHVCSVLVLVCAPKTFF